MRIVMYKRLIKLLVKLHNLTYKVITRMSIKAEGGLHPKHRLMNYHYFFIENVNPSDTVLDVGCGNGALTFDLSEKAKKVVGIDISSSNIRFAKARYNSDNIEYHVGDAIHYRLKSKFDVIVLSNMLEHIEDRVAFLKKMRTLAPRLLIRVPMINRDWLTLYKRELGVEWRLDSTHNIEYTLDSFNKELNQSGLRLISHSIQFGEIWALVE